MFAALKWSGFSTVPSVKSQTVRPASAPIGTRDRDAIYDANISGIFREGAVVDLCAELAMAPRMPSSIARRQGYTPAFHWEFPNSCADLKRRKMLMIRIGVPIRSRSDW
jgi:hypothetical protein